MAQPVTAFTLNLRFAGAATAVRLPLNEPEPIKRLVHNWLQVHMQGNMALLLGLSLSNQLAKQRQHTPGDKVDLMKGSSFANHPVTDGLFAGTTILGATLTFH